MFTNLLANAVKYSPDGGPIELTIAAEHRDDDPWITIELRDTGLGIPTAAQARIFERFYRAENVAGIEDTGLGLSGVRQIVREHGGTVSVASTEGKGTVFTVCLPCTLDDAEEQPSSTAPVASERSVG